MQSQRIRGKYSSSKMRRKAIRGMVEWLSAGGGCGLAAGATLALALSLAPGARLGAIMDAVRKPAGSARYVLGVFLVSEILYAAGLVAAAFLFLALPSGAMRVATALSAVFFALFATYQVIGRTWAKGHGRMLVLDGPPVARVGAASVNIGIWFDMLVPGAVAAAAVGREPAGVLAVAAGYVTGVMCCYACVAAAGRIADEAAIRRFWLAAVILMAFAGAWLAVLLGTAALAE